MPHFSTGLTVSLLISIISAVVIYISSDITLLDSSEASKNGWEQYKRKLAKIYAFLIAIVGITSSFCSYFLALQDAEDITDIKNFGEANIKLNNATIELNSQTLKLSNINKELIENNNKLSETNNQIATKNTLLINESKEIIDHTSQISNQINEISKQSASVLNIIDKKTDDEFAVTGTFSLKTTVDLNKSGGVNFKVGTNIFNYSLEELSKPLPISSVFNKITKLNSGFENISIRYSNNNIYLSGTIYDINKNIIVELVDNKWRVNKTFIYKFNFDDHGIELFNHLGQVVFSLDINERNQVQIQGISYNHDLNVVGISTTSGLVILNLLENNFHTRLDDALYKHKFMPIFEYTGNVWRRVRAKSTNNK